MANWSGAGGAAGAGDFLQKFLADKFAQEKFAEVQRQAKAAEAEQLAQRQQQAQEFHEQLAARQAEQVGARDERYQDRLADVQRNDQRIVEHRTERGEDVGWREKQAAAAKAADEAEQKWRSGESEAQRRNALQIAGIAADARGQHAEKYRKIEYYDPETQTNKSAIVTDAQAAAMGPLTPPMKTSAGMKDKLSQLAAVDRLANSIGGTGAKTNWRGVGPLAGRIKGITTEYGLAPDPQVERMHADISNLYSLISHERFGASFTAGEAATARGFLPTRNDTPSQLRSKLAGLTQFVKDRYADMSGGQAHEPQMPGAPPAVDLSSHGTAGPGGMMTSHARTGGGAQAPMTATNPATGEKLTSTDGGNTWH